MADGGRATERSLILRAQAGDRQAFGELVTKYMRRTYFAALGLVGSHEDALDLSQDAFVRTLRAVTSIDPDRPFYPWLYQTVRRLSFNFLRDRSSRRQKLEEASHWLTDAVESPDRAAERAEQRTLLEAAIARLSPTEREVLVLREFEGLKYREIGELLGIPNGTVMSRLYAARQSLAQQLEGKL